MWIHYHSLGLWLVVGAVILRCWFWNSLTKQGAGEAPMLDPLLYLLDQLVPIIDLPSNKSIGLYGEFADWFLAVWLLVGWTLAIAAIAGITRRLTRK